MPAGHAAAGVVPPVQTVPGAHATQPFTVVSVPGAHEPVGAHATEFGALPKVPLAHAAHV